MKICVLLSTYNGERYLEEQLESLVKQENVDVSILVRDDGSTDKTCEILSKWQNKGLLTWYSGGNKGFAMSFMDLLCHSGDYDYYAFCDQDDIWLPNKLDMAIKHLSVIQHPNKLYCSDALYYKNGENYGLIKKYIPKYNIYTCLVQNIAAGCTMVFSQGLRNLIASRMPSFIIAHDFWIYQVALILGDVYYDANSYILYRQHDNNQIGAKTGSLEKWKRRISRLLKSSEKESRSLQAKELLKCYCNEMDDEKQKIVYRIAEYKKNIWTRSRLFFDGRYTMGRLMNNVLMRIRIVLGKL